MKNFLKDKLSKVREAAEHVTSEHAIPIKFKVSEEVQNKRISICNECEHLHKHTNRCRKCGCFMGVKTWMKSQKCPIDKWGAEEIDEG